MRLLPYAGLLAVALWLAGDFVILGLTDVPGSSSSPNERLAYFRADPYLIYLGGSLFQLGSVTFVFFLGSLRARLARAEGDDGSLAAVAFGGGLATALSSFAIFTGFMVGATEREVLPAQSADVLIRLADVAFHAAQLFAIPLVVACALVALRTGVFPRAHAWLSLVLALTFLVPWTGWVALVTLFPVWVVATSVLLSRGRDAQAPVSASDSPLAVPSG
jgi:hypothetical protein